MLAGKVVVVGEGNCVCGCDREGDSRCLVEEASPSSESHGEMDPSLV